MDRALAETARWWSWRRQRLDRSCRDVGDALRSVAGVPGTNPHGPLALLARVPRLSYAAVDSVVLAKRALRIPAMRRELRLLPVESAGQVFAATAAPGPARTLVRRAGIVDTTYERLKRLILEQAQVPRIPDELRPALGRAPANLTPVLAAMCAEGVLLRVRSDGIRSNEWTYVAAEAWLGEPLAPGDASEALVWLAGDYLSAYGPASVDDFAAWSGVPRQRAEDALRSLDPVDLGGGMLLHKRDERAFSQTRPTLNRVNLLGRSDPYPMGYVDASRARFAAPRVRPRMYDAAGNSLPVVLVEGEVQGLWDVRLSARGATITLQMFERPGPALLAALEAEGRLVGSLLGAPRTTVERAKRPAPKAKSATPKARGTAPKARSAKPKAKGPTPTAKRPPAKPARRAR